MGGGDFWQLFGKPWPVTPQGRRRHSSHEQVFLVNNYSRFLRPHQPFTGPGERAGHAAAARRAPSPAERALPTDSCSPSPGTSPECMLNATAHSEGRAKSPLLPRDPQDKGEGTTTALDRRQPQLVGDLCSSLAPPGRQVALLQDACACSRPAAGAGQLQGAGWARLAQQPGRGRALGEAAHSSEGHRRQVSRACPTPPTPIPTFQATWPN